MLPNNPIQTVPGDADRRWLADDYFDLIVWYGSGGEIAGIQLCYDKRGRERALTWSPQLGFVHSSIDSGESTPLANRTPVLATNAPFPLEEIRREFVERSRLLPAELRDFVLVRLEESKSVLLDATTTQFRIDP